MEELGSRHGEQEGDTPRAGERWDGEGDQKCRAMIGDGGNQVDGGEGILDGRTLVLVLVPFPSQEGDGPSLGIALGGASGGYRPRSNVCLEPCRLRHRNVGSGAPVCYQPSDRVRLLDRLACKTGHHLRETVDRDSAQT